MAKTLLAPLRLWLQYLEGDVAPSLPSELTRNVMDVCVTICSVSTLEDARLALRIAQKLCTNIVPLSTRLALAKARSVVERLSSLEKLPLSDEIAFRAIEDAKAPGEIDASSRYALAQLYFSLTENSLLRNDLDLALTHVNQVNWLPDAGEVWPTLMLRLAHAKFSVLGRVLRYRGEFAEARGVLENCLRIGQGARMLNGDNIRRHLADVYCELGEMAKALELLRPRLDKLKSDGREHSRVYRRLSLPYADACTQSGDLEAALQLWRAVDDHFNQYPATNSTDELDHLRTAIALIRVSSNAEPAEVLSRRITNALELIAAYPSFTEPNYYRGLLLQARAQIYDRLARADRQSAASCDTGPRHFIALMGTAEREKLLR